MIIRCGACIQVPCVLSCDRNAVAYVCGDLLIELDKCTECGQYKGLQSPGPGIPDCVAACEYSQAKTVLEVPDAQTKQMRAANALSLLKPLLVYGLVHRQYSMRMKQSYHWSAVAVKKNQ
ncbi:hypothetical protein FACS1894137_16200 [Spirochaetia bacterium]|nr:hypothetical protein FACS1894137_16200 [Spirochaetia bacterium]